MSSDVRRYWVEELKLLEPGPDFKEYDAIETAMAQAISAGSTSQRARRAFQSLRGELRAAVMAGILDIWILVPREGLQFRWTTSAQAAAEVAAEIRGPLFVVSLEAAIQTAKLEYAKVMALTAPRPAAPVTKLARARTSDGAS